MLGAPVNKRLVLPQFSTTLNINGKRQLKQQVSINLIPVCYYSVWIKDRGRG